MAETQITPIKAARRRVSLTKPERAALVESQQIELAVSLFLDLEQDRTVSQIAAEMNMSVAALKRLTQKPEFQARYDEVLMGLGHHPRLQAVNAQLPELMPLAYQALKSVLTGQRVAATAKVQAVKLLFDTLHIADGRIDDDPAPLNNFLTQAGVNVQGSGNVINVNLPIPQEYQDAFARLTGTIQQNNVIEGTVSPDEPTE
jgi:hypothetical protein